MKMIFNHGYGLLQTIFFLGFGVSLIGCTKNSEADLRSKAGVVAPADTNSLLTPRKLGESCSSETFQLPDSQGKPVDVLFVVETSSSMSDVSQKIIQGMNGFVAGFPVHSDFNVAVMLAHGSTSAHAGKLFQVGSEPLVLQSSQLTNEQIQAHLNAKLTGAPADADSGGGEEGIFSLFHGITNPTLLAEAQAASFFRPNAALSVVVVADRRDICANVPEGVPAETDPLKIEARIRDCEGLTVPGLVNRLSLLKGSQTLTISGIIYADAPAPEGKEIGYGYTDMISLKNGTAIDIANADISAGLAPILALGGQAPAQNVFTLTQTDIEPTTIKVTVNGQEAPYTLEGTQVTITSPVPVGAVVVISGCAKGENPYEGNCKVFENADQWDSWTLTPSTEDLELKDRSGSFQVGNVRNLTIYNVSGDLNVMSAMAIPSISFLTGNSYIRHAGDITTISDSRSLRIDKAGNIGNVLNTKGGLLLNALSVGSYINAAGHACIRAQTIGKIQSMNGTKTFIASEIDELSVVSGTVHVYGAVIKSVIDTGGKVCLHNGAKVLNSSNVVSEAFKKCE